MSTSSAPTTNLDQRGAIQNYDTGLHTVNEEARADPEKEADFGRAYQKLVQKFYQE